MLHTYMSIHENHHISPLPAVGEGGYTDRDGARLPERDWAGLGSVMELDTTPSTVLRGVGAGDLLSIGLSMLVAME